MEAVSLNLFLVCLLIHTERCKYLQSPARLSRALGGRQQWYKQCFFPTRNFNPLWLCWWWGRFGSWFLPRPCSSLAVQQRHIDTSWTTYCFLRKISGRLLLNRFWFYFLNNNNLFPSECNHSYTVGDCHIPLKQVPSRISPCISGGISCKRLLQRSAFKLLFLLLTSGSCVVAGMSTVRCFRTSVREGYTAYS